MTKDEARERLNHYGEAIWIYCQGEGADYLTELSKKDFILGLIDEANEIIAYDPASGVDKHDFRIEVGEFTCAVGVEPL